METGGCKDPLNAIGDNGRSRGAYQIGQNYYNDAVQQNPSLLDGGRSYQNVFGSGSDAYSREVIQSYMDRYATENRLGHTPTDEDIARIHNGGPNGFRRESTEQYWNRVDSNLGQNKRQATEPYIGCADCDDAVDESVPTPCNGGSMDNAKTYAFTILLAFAVAFMYTCG